MLKVHSQLTGQADTQAPPCLSPEPYPLPQTHTHPLGLSCPGEEEVPGDPAVLPAAWLPAGATEVDSGWSRALTPIGEHFSTNLSSWDLAVPGSPNISRLMSPRRVSPSGSLREFRQVNHTASTRSRDSGRSHGRLAVAPSDPQHYP